MIEIMRNTIEKLKREKVAFFIIVGINFLLYVFFSEYVISCVNKSKFANEVVLKVFETSFFILPILSVRLFILKEKIKDLFHPKVLINLILITLFSYNKMNIVDFDSISPFYGKIIAAMMYNFTYYFLFSANKENKIVIPFVDLFKNLYKKQNLILFLFLVVILNSFFNFVEQDFNFYRSVLQRVYFLMLSIIKTFLIVLIYDVIKMENKISKYIKGKFSKLYFKLVGINLVIVLIWRFVNRIQYYFIGKEWIIFLIFIIVIYLIMEFEIREILKFYNVDMKRELICRKNLVSYMILMLKIAIVFGLGYLFLDFMNFSLDMFNVVTLLCIFYVVYSIWYCLTVEFLKGRLDNSGLKFYKIIKNKKILILSLGGLEIIIINIANVGLLDYLISGVGTLYITCSIVYEILEKNGYCNSH